MSHPVILFAYPSRRTVAAPVFNPALHLSVIFGVGLQLLTFYLPALRTLLGLELLTPASLLWVASAVMLSWGMAELYVRLAMKPSDRRAR